MAIKQEALDNVSLKSLVERHTKLIPAGRNSWKGLSPFSVEKTPSFMVYEDKKTWYCYSTQQGGGVLNFIMLTEGLSKPEAVKYLYDLAGVSYEENVPQQDDGLSSLRAVIKLAYEYSMEDVTKVHEYLSSRGYDTEISSLYHVGYIGDGHALLNKLLKAGFSKETITDAGLATLKGDRLLPFFSHRVVFPIRDKNGVIVGFTGRTLDDEIKPKYLNSRETPIFKKGEVLWGYESARSLINKQDRVFICEGNFDVILQQLAGIPAVGTLSATLTDAQLSVLGRIANNIYLTFDMDAAGKRAMTEASLKIQNLGLDTVVYAVTLPEGHKDPADFISKEGFAAYQELVAKALPDTESLIANLYDAAMKKSGTLAGAKRIVLEQIKPYILSNNFTYRGLDMMERLSQVLNLSKSQLTAWLDTQPPLTHSSSTYSKINSITFPAPIYERRLMTECLKDMSKHSIVFSNVNRYSFESHLVLKVLDILAMSEDDISLFENLNESLDKEEFSLVMDVFGQSYTENYDVLFLCGVMNSNRASLPRERISNILGRKKPTEQKDTKSSLREILRNNSGYKNL